MSDPFAPPIPPVRVEPTDLFLVVRPRVFRSLPADVQEGLARLARRPSDRVIADVRAGKPAVLLRSTAISVAEASALVEELLGVETRPTGPVQWSKLGVMGGLLLGWSIGAIQAVADGESLGYGRAFVSGGLALGIWRNGLAPAATRHHATAVWPQHLLPVPTLAEAATCESAQAALGTLGALILAEPIGSEVRVAALREAARLRGAGDDLNMSRRLANRADRESMVAATFNMS